MHDGKADGRRMNVLLIKPPYTRIRGTGQAPYFPLGLGYIAAVLNQNGFTARIYHGEDPGPDDPPSMIEPDIGFRLRSDSHKQMKAVLADREHPVWREVRQVLQDLKPDVVGITLLSVEVGPARKIAELVKEYRPDCPVVWGGVHPTFMPESCLVNMSVDYVIRREGEYAMLDLCRALRDGGGMDTIAGLSWKKNGKTIHNPERGPIPDINVLPLPDRTALVFPERCDFRTLGSMIISRGCPYRCAFCSSRNFWDKKVRFRSPENLVQEIEFLVREHGCRQIMFWDDTLTFNEQIVRRYCDAILKAGLRITWKAATRADLIHPELLKLMKKAGCVKLEIGVESGSDRIKKLIFKDVTNDQVRQAFRQIEACGIGSGAFFMAGFPEETVEDLDQTFNLIQTLEATEIAFNILDPMPGSAEYDKCIQLGLLPKDADWNDFRFWPDAHYAAKIPPEVFMEYANRIAAWVYRRNNSLRYRFKRNRQLLFSLLFIDPGLLFRKIINLVSRRLTVRKAGQPPSCRPA